VSDAAPSAAGGHASGGFARNFAAMILTATATCLLAEVWNTQLLLFGVGWLLLGFVLIPGAFAIALYAVALVLIVLLSLLALPHILRGGRTGLPGLFEDLLRLAGHVLPGYARALLRVRPRWILFVPIGYVLGVLAWPLLLFFPPLLVLPLLLCVAL